MSVAAGENKGWRVVSLNSLRLYAFPEKREKHLHTQLCEFQGTHTDIRVLCRHMLKRVHPDTQ